MPFTRAQLRAAVISNTNRGDRVGFINDSLNFALDEISTRHVFRCLRSQVTVSVVADDNSFDLPEGMAKLVSVRLMNTNNTIVHNLCIKPKRILEELYPSLGQNNNSGIPTYGYQEGRTIYFLPRTSNDYSMLVTGDALAGNLAADTDVSSIPNSDPAVIAWTTAEVFRSIQMLEEAQAWDQQFEKRLVILTRFDKARPAEKAVFQTFPAALPQEVTDPTTDPFYGM